jgi:hypothetical protein
MNCLAANGDSLAMTPGRPLVQVRGFRAGPRQQIFAGRLESLVRLGRLIIRISRPRLRVLMLSNPLNRVIFRNEALDYSRFAIGP